MSRSRKERVIVLDNDDCPLCDSCDHEVYITTAEGLNARPYVEDVNNWGWHECPGCDGTGKVAPALRTALLLLASKGRPHFDDIKRLVNDFARAPEIEAQ